MPRLFSAILRENLLLRLSEADLELEQAIYAAVLEKDVADLESGLDTVVGPKGVKLSGGPNLIGGVPSADRITVGGSDHRVG